MHEVSLLLLLSHQREGASGALLEVVGRKGYVQVNGKTFERNSNIVITAGDEVIFSPSGKHAYVSFYNLLLDSRYKLQILLFSKFSWKEIPYLLADISATEE